MHAIYAWCRTADDLVDTNEPGEERRRRLQHWAEQLERPTHPIALAFADVRARYGIDAQPAHDMIAGLERDIAFKPFADWSSLRDYCYAVAGTVGVMVAPVLGGRSDPETIVRAADMGIAMQLTNILRDVAEDATLGRLYLPVAELTAFKCDADRILAMEPDPNLPALIRFQVTRTRGIYARSREGLPALSRVGRATAGTASAFYELILDGIEANGCDVLAGRVHVPLPTKLRRVPGVLVQSVRWRFG